jgi:hypothetical protein
MPNAFQFGFSTSIPQSICCSARGPVSLPPKAFDLLVDLVPARRAPARQEAADGRAVARDVRRRGEPRVHRVRAAQSPGGRERRQHIHRDGTHEGLSLRGSGESVRRYAGACATLVPWSGTEATGVRPRPSGRGLCWVPAGMVAAARLASRDLGRHARLDRLEPATSPPSMSRRYGAIELDGDERRAAINMTDARSCVWIDDFERREGPRLPTPGLPDTPSGAPTVPRCRTASSTRRVRRGRPGCAFRPSKVRPHRGGGPGLPGVTEDWSTDDADRELPLSAADAPRERVTVRLKADTTRDHGPPQGGHYGHGPRPTAHRPPPTAQRPAPPAP